MKKLAYMMTIGAFWLAAAATPINAADSSSYKPALASAVSTSAPSVKSPTMLQRFRTAQLVGNICRNGGYYCVMPGTGFVGYACCGCNFCGLWSTF